MTPADINLIWLIQQNISNYIIKYILIILMAMQTRWVVVSLRKKINIAMNCHSSGAYLEYNMITVVTKI